MTTREMLVAIVNDDMGATDPNGQTVRERARQMLDTIDRQQHFSDRPLKFKIIEFLTEKNEEILASVIGEAIGVSTAKAASLCRQLFYEDKIAGEEKEIPNVGKRKVWSIKKD